ncbi:MAG: ClpXP protease specificity-enhancing factor SspB [Paenacidovorax caeni]
MQSNDATSTRPYLIRALYEWCTDNGFTPYVVVRVDASVQVPREYVKDGEIVLNVSYDATEVHCSWVTTTSSSRRFRWAAAKSSCLSIMSWPSMRENGQGMAFPPPRILWSSAPALSQPLESSGAAPAEERVVQLTVADTADSDAEEPRPVPPAGGGGRPAETCQVSANWPMILRRVSFAAWSV